MKGCCGVLLVRLSLLCVCLSVCYGADEEGVFPEYLLNCTGRTQKQLKALNLSFSIAAIVSLLFVSLVFVVTLCHKAYKNTLERLFLYLLTVTGTQLFLLSISFMHSIKYNGDGTLCKCLGFINQYTGALQSFLTVSIGVTLLLTTYKYLILNRSRSQSKSNNPKSRWYMQSLEILFFIFAAIFPVLYIWWPFLDDGYGFDGITCWVQSFDEDCNHIGLEIQLIFFSLGVAHDVILIIVALLLAAIYTYAFCKFRHIQMTILMSKTLLLMIFVFIRGIVGVFIGILSRIYIASYVFSFVYATTIVFVSLLVIPIGYLLYLFANQHHLIYFFGCNSNRGCLGWCKVARKQRNPAKSPLVHSNNNATTPSSTRVSPASYTETVSPVYTGIGITTDAIDNNS